MHRRAAPLRLYVEVARRAFRRFSTYRAATMAGLLTNTVFGFLRAFVFLAVFAKSPDVGGFDAVDAVTFVFLSQGFIAPMGGFGPNDVAERIRTGDIVTDLYRPVDFQLYWLAHDWGRIAFSVLGRGIVPFLAGGLVFDLQVPSGAGLAAFAVALVLALTLSFLLRFIVSLTAFWLLDIRGAMQLYIVFQMFFCGMIVPLVFFPPALATVARLTPFPSILQLPAEIWLGLPAGGSVAGHLGQQVLWLIVALVAGRALLGVAVRRVVVQGG